MKTDLHTFVVEEEHQLPGVGHPLVDEQELLSCQAYAGLSLDRYPEDQYQIQEN